MMRKVSQNDPDPPRCPELILELRLVESERAPILGIPFTLDVDGDGWRITEVADVAQRDITTTSWRDVASTNDVYDTILLSRVSSTTRCRVGLCAFDSASSTNLRWLETRIATRCLTILPLISEEVGGSSCRASSPVITSPASTSSAIQQRVGMLSPPWGLLIIA
jgi:hypothetical protein